MIVLDEHLQGLSLELAIARWYRGRVCLVTELRPGIIIQDEMVPNLLLTLSQPTFVTLNSRHFWEQMQAHPGFCIVCLTLPTDRAAEVPNLMRRLFRLATFKSKATRMGKIARISGEEVAYYQTRDPRTHRVPLP
jgi:hypothetical protein